MFLHWQRLPYAQRSAYGNATTNSRRPNDGDAAITDAGWGKVYQYVSAGELLSLPDPTAALAAMRGSVALDELTPTLARAIDWPRVWQTATDLLVAICWNWDASFGPVVKGAPKERVTFLPELFVFGDCGPNQGPEDDAWPGEMLCRLGELDRLRDSVPCFIVTDRPDLRKSTGRRDLSSCEGDPGLKSYLDGLYIKRCRLAGVKSFGVWGWGRGPYGYSTPASESAFERTFLANY
jgi:hypothetical protein